MLELEVMLETACTACGETFGVTVRCGGRGLAAGKDALTVVKAPCPNPDCDCINRIVFAPVTGEVHSVTALNAPILAPQPSYN